MKSFKLFLLVSLGLFFSTGSSAQTDSDGDMRIFHYTDYFYTDNDDEWGTDEHTWYYYRGEQANIAGAYWDQAGCWASNCGGGCYGYPGWGLDLTYGGTVPTQFRMRGEYWEDDGGGRCSRSWYDDDYSSWEQQYNVRQGCPYVWSYYGWQGNYWRNVHYTSTYYSSPRPDYARANNSSALTICGPGTVTLSSAGRQCGNSYYYWYIAGGAYIGRTYGTLSAYVSSTTTFRVYTNDQGANSYSSRDVTVTVASPPTANAGSNISHCSTSNITTNGASATGSSLSYSWTWTPSVGTAVLSSATSLNGWVLNPSSDSGSGTLTLTVSSPGCPSATSTRNVTWDRPPSGTAGGAITQCFTGALSAITMSTAGMNGFGETVTGTWSTQGGSGTGTWSQNTSNPEAATFTPTSNSGSRTMRLRVQSTSGECSGNIYDYTTTITWNRVVLDAGTPVTQCDLSNITTSDATIVGSGYGSATWTYISTAGSATLNNATSLNGCFLSGLSAGGGTGILRLTVTGNSPCGTQTSDKNVQWSAGPLGNAGSTLNVCSGSGTPIAMTGATGGGASGTPTWTGGAGLGTWTNGGSDPAAWTFTPNAGNPTNSFTATLNVSGTAPCTGTATPTTRTVSWTTPPTGSIGGTVNSCDGSAAIILTGASAGGSLAGTPFTWSVISGGGSVTGSGNNPATYQYSTPGATGSAELQLVVNAGGHCTTDLSYTQNINWGDITANSPASITSCGNTVDIDMAGTVTGQYSSVSWTGESGGAWSTTNLTNPAAWVFDPVAASGNFNATLTVNGVGSCIGETETSVTNVDWDVYPTVEAGSNIEVCTGAGVAIGMGASPSAGGQYGSMTWATQSASYGAGNWTNGGVNPDDWTFTPTSAEGLIVASLTVLGDGNCSGTDIVDTRTIQWSAAPVITSVVVTNQTDCNNPNGTIVIAATGNGTLVYSSDNGALYQPLDTMLGISLGTYDIMVSDAVGCATAYASNPVAVGGPTPVTAASVTITAQNLCAGGISGEITITGMSGGGGGPFEYGLEGLTGARWFDALGDPIVIDSLAADVYDVVVRDQFGCMSVVYQRIITEPTAITISALNIIDVVGCGSSGTGSIAVTASGGTGTLNYYLNDGINSPATLGSWPALSGGSYEVMVQDANSCQTVAQASINAPWTVTAGNDIYKCGATSASLQGEIIGALPTDCTPSCTSGCGQPSGYCGSAGSNVSDDWISYVGFNTISQGSGSTTYSNYTGVSTSVNRGAAYTLNVTVRKSWYWEQYVRAYFDWNRDGDFNDAGEYYNLGSSYANPQSAALSITIPGTASLGNTRMRIIERYEVYSSTNGCQNSTYMETEDYNINIVGAPATCVPSYSWSPSGGSALAATVNPASTATYTLTVNDGAGCIQSDQVVVNVSNQTTTSTQQNVDCFGGADGCVTLNPTNGIQPYLMFGPSNTVQVYGGSMRPITVNNTSGSGYTNHPVKMTIPFSAGMRADFGNMRFYDSNQAKLSYWVESYGLSSSAVVWVKMPTLPTGNSTLYMTYGNVSLRSESDGDAVFEFFDNFNSFDATKWTQGTISATTGTNWSYYGGQLIGGNSNRIQTSTATFTGSRISEARTYESSSAGNGFTNIGFWSSTSNAYNILSHNGANYVRNDAGWVNFSAWGAGQRNTWMREYVRANGASSRVERTRESLGGTLGQNSNNSGLSGERIRLGARGDNLVYNQNFSAQWDWMFVRPYISTEPAITLGAVQTSDNQFCGFAINTYSFNVVDVSGCNNSVNVTITEPAAALSVSLAMTSTACYGGNDGTIDLTAVGGTQLSSAPSPSYYYTWAGPSGYSASTEDLTGLATGVYNVTLADDNACSVNGSITVTQLTPISSPNYTWTGNASQLWQVDDNWDCRVPTQNDDVIIPASPIGGNNPIIQNGIQGDCNTIKVEGNSFMIDIQDSGNLKVWQP